MIKKVTCLLTHEYPPMTGGVGVSSRRVSQLLSRHGFEVHVVILKKSELPVLVGDNVTSYQDGPVTVHEVMFSTGKFEARTNMDQLTVSENGFLNHHGSIDALLSLRLLHERYRFQSINAFFISHVGLVATIFGKLEKVPVMLSIRGNDVGKNVFASQHLPVLQYVLKNADVVTSVSSDLLAVAKTICPLSKSYVINNSFDWKRLDNRTPKKHHFPGKVIGSVGIFRYKKGIPQLLRALESVVMKDPSWTLLLVGDYQSKEERQYHEYFIDRSPIKDRIHLTGLVSAPEVFDYLECMDIFVAPSLFSEGCPNTVLEAMAMKKAIIASDAGAIPEILKSEVTGIVYPQVDLKQLSSSIQRLIDDPSLGKRLGENAFAKLKEFDQDIEWMNWALAYSQIHPL